MLLVRRLFAKPRTPNIIVYGIAGNDGNGNLLSQPAGFRPRLPKEIEDKLVNDHRKKHDYVYEGIDIFEDSSIVCVSYDRVDTIYFLSMKIAGKYCVEIFDIKMYEYVAQEDAREWPNRIFNHFPCGKITADHAQKFVV